MSRCSWWTLLFTIFFYLLPMYVLVEKGTSHEINMGIIANNTALGLCSMSSTTYLRDAHLPLIVVRAHVDEHGAGTDYHLRVVAEVLQNVHQRRHHACLRVHMAHCTNKVAGLSTTTRLVHSKQIAAIGKLVIKY